MKEEEKEGFTIGDKIKLDFTCGFNSAPMFQEVADIVFEITGIKNEKADGGYKAYQVVSISPVILGYETKHWRDTRFKKIDMIEVLMSRIGYKFQH